MCLTRDEEWESGQVTTGPAIEKTTTRRKKEANGSRTWVEETDLSDEKRRLLGSTRAWNVQKGGIVSRQTDSNGREKWPKSHRPHSNSFYQKNLPSSFSLSLRQIEKTTTWLQCSLSRPAPGIFSFIYNNRPDMCAPVARLLFFFLRLLLPSLVFFLFLSEGEWWHPPPSLPPPPPPPLSLSLLSIRSGHQVFWKARDGRI